jgi:hypothetical protein
MNPIERLHDTSHLIDDILNKVGSPKLINERISIAVAMAILPLGLSNPNRWSRIPEPIPRPVEFVRVVGESKVGSKLGVQTNTFTHDLTYDLFWPLYPLTNIDVVEESLLARSIPRER